MSDEVSLHEWTCLLRSCDRTADLRGWAKQFVQEAIEGRHVRGELNGIRYTTEKLCLQQDYLDFLQQQIALNARGDDWSALLERRRQHLAGWIGRELIHLFAIRDGHSLSVYYEPTENNVVYAEADYKQFQNRLSTIIRQASLAKL